MKKTLWRRLKDWLIVKLGGYTEQRQVHLKCHQITVPDPFQRIVAVVYLSRYRLVDSFAWGCAVREAKREIAHKIAEELMEQNFILLESTEIQERDEIMLRGSVFPMEAGAAAKITTALDQNGQIFRPRYEFVHKEEMTP